MQFPNYTSPSIGKFIKGPEKDFHEDTVQAIEVDRHNGSGLFFTAGWDGTIKAWQLVSSSPYHTPYKVQLRGTFPFPEMVLSVTASADYILYAGLANGEIKAFTPTGQSIVNVGSQLGGVIFLQWISEISALLSCGLDNVLNFYQLANGGYNIVASLQLPERTCCVDVSYPYMAICSINKVRVYRIDNPSMCDFSGYYESPFEKNTKINSIAINAKSMLIVMGTIDGYIGYCYFNENGQMIRERFVVAPLAAKEPYKTTLFPVNTLRVLNNGSSSIIVGGMDNRLVFYSANYNKELKTYKTKQGSPTALNTIRIGDKQFLIVCIGNDWSLGMDSLDKGIKAEMDLKEILEGDFKI